MKIGFIIEHYDPRRGGAETYINRLVTDLVVDGHEVHVFSQSFSAPLPEGIEAHGVTVAGIGGGFRLLSFDKHSGDVAARFDLDVLMSVGKTHHMNVFQPHGGTYRATLKQNQASRKPGWFGKFLSHLKLRKWLFLYMEHRQYQHPQKKIFVAISKMVRDDMIRYYKVPEERIALIYNGVDCEQFTPDLKPLCRKQIRKHLGLHEDDIMLLIVAHNFRLKGVAQLIEATGRIDRGLRDRYKVVVVGKGHKHPFKKPARNLGIDKQVIFTGAVEVPQEYYAAADVYCQPTFYDPCSLTVLEALASGLPTITTRFNGASELMVQGREGYILENPDDLATFVKHLETLADAELRQTMAEAARSTALEHTIEKNFQEMMIVFKRAATEKVSGPL